MPNRKSSHEAMALGQATSIAPVFQAAHFSTNIFSSSQEPISTEDPSSRTLPHKTRTAFISGPLAPDPKFFETQYKSRLLAAIAAGDSFVIGSSRGIDALALDFLRAQHVSPSRVQIFFYAKELHGSSKQCLRKALEKAGIREVIKGRNHTERDDVMTAASDYDILAYLSANECMALYGDKYREMVSGTEQNEQRRAPSKLK